MTRPSLTASFVYDEGRRISKAINGILNGLSNTVSDLLFLDKFAEWSWTLGNWCKPMSERLWAAAHLGSEVVMTVFGGQIMKGVGGAIFKRIPCNNFTTKWLNKACFVKGTLVHTKKALKKIEEIKAGDEVLSYNEQTRQTEYKPVIETYIRQTEEIIEIKIEGEAKAIETTPEHPFYVRIHRARDSIGDDDGGEWREAESLRIGDEALSASGQWQRVVSVERQARSEQVYNFAVEDNQNYFVGQVGTLVHNKCHLHHSDPKFLGGAPKQPLTKLPDDVHRNLHKDMNEFLKGVVDDFGNNMYPRGNGGAAIRGNFTRNERLNALKDFYDKFGGTYPTAARDFFMQHPYLK